MKYAKQNQDGSFLISDLASLCPDVSFPDIGPDALWLSDQHIFQIESALVFDPKVYRRREIAPTLIGSQVHTAELVPLTEKEKLDIAEEETAARMSEVRIQRDNLLSACDWTQLSDAPVNKASWAAYRQLLRDIPKQTGFPNSVMWPSEPV
jgi:hypothetical protein